MQNWQPAHCARKPLSVCSSGYTRSRSHSAIAQPVVLPYAMCTGLDKWLWALRRVEVQRVIQCMVLGGVAVLRPARPTGKSTALAEASSDWLP